MTSPGEEALGLLLDRSHHLHPDELTGGITDAVTMIGGTDVVLFLADIAQELLVPYGVEADAVEIDGTLAGRAFRTNAPVVIDDDGGRRAWFPVLDGSDRLGVLGVTLPTGDDHCIQVCSRIAALSGELVVSRSQYGDSVNVARRTKPLTLAAELRWSMLPPLTFETRSVAIGAILEPAYDVAGDTFDYAVTGENARFGVFDAMGHGLEAARIANLVMGAYRHARRTGLDLAGQYEHITAAILSEFEPSKFATGVLADLALGSGQLRLVLAGHPPPLLLRNHRVVGELEVAPSTPLGIAGIEPTVGAFDLEPGDRVLLYTDGVVEARHPNGQDFGLDRLADFVVRAAASDEPLAETMRRVAKAILAHQEGQLQDDATLLMVHWRP